MNSNQSRRRRRHDRASARATPVTQRALRWLQGRGFRRLLVALVLLGAIVHVIKATWTFYSSQQQYAMVGNNDHRTDVLYAYGKPEQVSLDGQGWTAAGNGAIAATPAWSFTAASGARIEVRFNDDADRVESVTCRSTAKQSGTCEPLYGIGGETAEPLIRRHLGRAGIEQMSGTAKSMIYPELGAEYRLERYAVVAVVKRRPQSAPVTLVWRWLVSLVPMAVIHLW